ncbi:MAG TPA: glycosyltransferase family 39 protein [Rhizomicrobium sp.]|nr:glycosyltransferase family 39 protein [Rhizomicrobium sp.]
MELRHVHPVRLARAVTQGRIAFFLIGFLILVRAAMAGLLPLSADEAYYWLWSKYPAAGYYDHPPAIAFLIRLGTSLFGDTEFGVRFGGVLLSILASLFVWQAGREILKDETRAALAALLFNLTLMIGVEMLALTPDTPSIAATAAFLFCLAKLQSSGKGHWWLWAGLAAGLGLLSKYSGLFVGAGALFWLFVSPRARGWLTGFWPWVGGALALAIFLPNLWWQSQHHWMTFAFQFGRVTNGHLTLRFLFEFLGAELGLATPFIFVLAALGAWHARARDDDRFLLLALIAPALVYFLIHALHDRVQGNWPCFLFPMLAILAADAFAPDASSNWRRWCSLLAMPVAGLALLLAYAQAATGVVPMKHDPLARLLGIGMKDVGLKIQAEAQRENARAVVTGDYETTAWLRFYAPTLAVIAIDQPNRYLDAPVARFGTGPWLYVADRARGQDQIVIRNFTLAAQRPDLARVRNGIEIASFSLWQLAEPKSSLQGKKP